MLAIPFTFLISTILDKVNKYDRKVKLSVLNYIGLFDIVNIIIFICTLIIIICEFSLY